MDFKLKGNYEEEFAQRMQLMTEALEKPIGLQSKFDKYTLDYVSENFDKEAALDFINSLQTEIVTEKMEKMSIDSQSYCVIGRKKKQRDKMIVEDKEEQKNRVILSFMDID